MLLENSPISPPLAEYCTILKVQSVSCQKPGTYCIWFFYWHYSIGLLSCVFF